MSTTLAVVTAAEPAVETPTLSAARAALARAQGLRKDADDALSEAVKSQKAADQLVGVPDKIKARIVELERKTAGAVEPWATASGRSRLRYRNGMNFPSACSQTSMAISTNAISTNADCGQVFR